MSSSKKYATILWILLGLFSFRVAAQLFQLAFDSPYLPPFDAWYSGALAYPYLLLSQIIIIGIYSYICVQFAKGTVSRSSRAGVFFLAIGGVYASFMLGRLLIGQLFTSSAWFHAYIPIFFHFILALFLIVVGIFHTRNTQVYVDPSSK